MLHYGKEEKYCITFDVLTVLIIVPIESKNDLVEATFYGSHLKQFNAECTALDCDFHCYVMAMRGEILYMFDALKVLIIVPIKSCNDIVEATFCGSCQLPAMQESGIIVTC